MAARIYYASPESALLFTGLKPGDLEGLNSSGPLTALAEEWLIEIKSLIDEYVERDFAQEEEDSRPTGGGDPEDPVPPAINLAAKRAFYNYVMLAQNARNSPQPSADELAASQSNGFTAQILSNDIRADLKLFRQTLEEQKRLSPIRMWVASGKESTTDDAYYPREVG